MSWRREQRVDDNSTFVPHFHQQNPQNQEYTFVLCYRRFGSSHLSVIVHRLRWNCWCSVMLWGAFGAVTFTPGIERTIVPPNRTAEQHTLTHKRTEIHTHTHQPQNVIIFTARNYATFATHAHRTHELSGGKFPGIRSGECSANVRVSVSVCVEEVNCCNGIVQRRKRSCDACANWYFTEFAAQ